MKKLLSLLILASVLIFFGALIIGCEQIDNEKAPEIIEETIPDYPVSVGQMTFNESPESVVSLSPALTEIICELGYENKLIGRSSYCDYPETAVTKPDVGSSANPDIDTIISLSPKLLISQSPIAKKDISKLEKSDIRVLIIPAPNNYPELRKIYVDISMLFGGGQNAEQSADVCIAPLEQALLSVQPNIKFAYIMTRDLSICTGDTFANDILSYFGTNIAAENKNYYVTTDELTANQPDVLFLAAPMNIANLDPKISELTAVQNGMVIPIDNTNFERPTARRILALVNSLRIALENDAEIDNNASSDTQQEPETSAQETQQQ